MKLPPEGMDGRTADMFVDARKQQLSLQGALQHYLDKCWEGRVLSRGQSSHVQTVPHPWPGYIEESAPLSHEPLPGHLLRMLVYRGPRKPCARMSPTVRKRLGWTKVLLVPSLSICAVIGRTRVRQAQGLEKHADGSS
jgi:hypothetical protein